MTRINVSSQAAAHVNAGAVLPAAPGTYYLDEAGYRLYRKTRRRRVLAILLALAIALALALLVTRS